MLDDARRHLVTTRLAVRESDLAGAYQLAYDAAGKACTAVLESRGLRVRGPAAHTNLIIFMQELYAGAPGAEALQQLDRMRRTRNTAEYHGYPFDPAELEDDLANAEAVVATATDLVQPSAR
ncbi:MAG: HEPN domain-containing protein [Candidatus Dormiibacterota bacterium]